MASDDIYRLTHVYEVADERMYWNQWYLEQGNTVFQPAPRLALQWEQTVLPLMAECWSNKCKSLYTAVYRVWPEPDIPGLEMSTWVGQRDFPSLPMTAGGILSAYAQGQGIIRRSSLRIGGLAENLADNGVLVSIGISTLQTLADVLAQHVPYAGSGGSGWYPGVWSGIRGWADWITIQVRRELGSQKTRRVRRGGRP